MSEPQQFQFLLTNADRKTIKQAALRSGISMATFVRRSALHAAQVCRSKKRTEKVD
jgi:uncharacterized protein (DUF1778 family)